MLLHVKETQCILCYTLQIVQQYLFFGFITSNVHVPTDVLPKSLGRCRLSPGIDQCPASYREEQWGKRLAWIKAFTMEPEIEKCILNYLFTLFFVLDKVERELEYFTMETIENLTKSTLFAVY